jgi:23S rRNA (cytidine2498-2'-O)-methyltransferase
LSSFIYLTCQPGSEQTLKNEVSAINGLRFAFSKPGFITFKTDEDNIAYRRNAVIRCRDFVFAQTAGHSFGVVKVEQTENNGDIADKIWSRFLESEKTTDVSIYAPIRIHCWERCGIVAGENGYEPSISRNALAMHKQLVSKVPLNVKMATGAKDPFLPAQNGDNVLDCVAVTSNEWWLGTHYVDESSGEHSRWAGGVVPLQLPADAVSRAWLKFEEAIRWSGIEINNGDTCLDIGAAPGGASQALLARGASVIGLDPGVIAPQVLQNPNFTHSRFRTNQVKKKTFKNIRWIISDMNVAPNYTLETLEDFINNPELKISGLLFTLKLFNKEMADSIPSHLKRIRNWGFKQVKAKQLIFNRQEIMVACK